MLLATWVLGGPQIYTRPPPEVDFEGLGGNLVFTKSARGPLLYTYTRSPPRPSKSPSGGDLVYIWGPPKHGSTRKDLM